MNIYATVRMHKHGTMLIYLFIFFLGGGGGGGGSEDMLHQKMPKIELGIFTLFRNKQMNILTGISSPVASLTYT